MAIKCAAYVLKTMQQCRNNATQKTIDGICVCTCHKGYDKKRINDSIELSRKKKQKKENDQVIIAKNMEVVKTLSHNQIPLRSQGIIIGHALVSSCDYETVIKYKWHQHKITKYVFGIANDVYSTLHQFIIGKAPEGYVIDHINGVRTDCRRENLRFATFSENSQNHAKIEGVTSKYIGVSWCKTTNKWVVNCKLNKTSRQIGTFSQDKEEEAGKLYDTCVIVHSDNPGNCKTNNLVNWEDIKDTKDELLQKLKEKKPERVYPTGISPRKSGGWVVQVRYGPNFKKAFETKNYTEAVQKLAEFQEILQRVKLQEIEDYASTPILRNNIGQAIIQVKDREIIVDDSKWHELSRYTWNIKDAYVKTEIYIGDDKKCVSMHRLLMNVCGKKCIIDHKNQNKNDNRISNLRIATHGENNHNVNRKTDKSLSKYHGVDFVKDDMNFRARVRVSGNVINIGRFKTEEEAARAYNIEVTKHYDSPVLNVIV